MYLRIFTLPAIDWRVVSKLLMSEAVVNKIVKLNNIKIKKDYSNRFKRVSMYCFRSRL